VSVSFRGSIQHIRDVAQQRLSLALNLKIHHVHSPCPLLLFVVHGRARLVWNALADRLRGILHAVALLLLQEPRHPAYKNTCSLPLRNFHWRTERRSPELLLASLNLLIWIQQLVTFVLQLVDGFRLLPYFRSKSFPFSRKHRSLSFNLD
jgi:hypothetical protein